MAIELSQRERHVNSCIERRPGRKAAQRDSPAPAAAAAAPVGADALPQAAAAAGTRGRDAAAAFGMPEKNVAGYASRLRQDVPYGVCGLKETYESDRAVAKKAAELAALFRRHRGRVWCCTGAGISTSAGLPDFRGPQGIWTQQQQAAGKGRKGRAATASQPAAKRARGGAAGSASSSGAAPCRSFADVKPSLTHMALTALVDHGYINHIATQNVDGLHRRAGAPLDRLSELHGEDPRVENNADTGKSIHTHKSAACPSRAGNVCLEQCKTCGLEHMRDDDVGGVGLKPTGNLCECGGQVHQR
eukprot:SAG22_NODE_1401_length_4497_cov_101.460891_2_plen_303_part_00